MTATSPTLVSWPTRTADETTVMRREPRQRWGLRRRIMLIFTLGALMLSLFLAFVTYGFARSSVVQQREDAALDAAKRNTPDRQLGARRQRHQRRRPRWQRLEDVGVARPLIWYNGQWTPGDAGYDQSELPQSLVDRVINDATAGVDAGRGRQRAQHRRRPPAAATTPRTSSSSASTR